MEIDDRVESLVRETLTGVIHRDRDRLARAIQAFPDDDSTTTGVRLASAVASYILIDQYGRIPNEGEVRSIADGVAEMESWSDVTSDEVAKYITAVVGGVRLDQVLPLDRVLLLSYVVAGNLLSSCHKDGEEWWNYLDRAEGAIEAASAS